MVITVHAGNVMYGDSGNGEDGGRGDGCCHGNDSDDDNFDGNRNSVTL